MKKFKPIRKIMKKLPVSNFTFENIILEHYLYVDKTRELFELINFSKYAFLSRPRRFGKSMLVSTLKAFFSGKKELFKDLWIADKVQWETYPVIHLDFALVLTSGNKKQFRREMTRILGHIAEENGLDIKVPPTPSYFDELIYRLHQKTGKPVVLLIDEYDKPITDHFTNIKKAKKRRKWLKEYYAILKPREGILKYVFVTGISKFAKLSIFSVLNNVKDITVHDKFNTIVGFTQQEIKENFANYLQLLQTKTGLKEKVLLEKIAYWYDGYSWGGKESVYNPYSIVNLFADMQFKNFWFRSGTPALLVNYIIQQAEQGSIDRQPSTYENVSISEELLDSVDIRNINLISLLFHTGYLTVKNISITEDEKVTYISYTLGYPNYEVRYSMTTHILEAFAQIPSNHLQPDAQMLRRHLLEGNLEAFMVILRRFFARIPYQLREKADEAYYHSLFQLILLLIGVEMFAENSTDKGRIDGVLIFENVIYIIEFKYARKGTMAYLYKKAFEQMKKNKYGEAFQGSSKKVKFLAVGFLEKQKNKKGEQVLEMGYWVNDEAEYLVAS